MLRRQLVQSHRLSFREQHPAEIDNHRLNHDWLTLGILSVSEKHFSADFEMTRPCREI
jgi:hypothetical protein